MKEVIRYTSPVGEVSYFFVLQWAEGKRHIAEVVSDIRGSAPAHICWFPVKQEGKVEVFPASYARVKWLDMLVRRIAEAESPLQELAKIGRKKLMITPDGKSLA